jgi:hypothetical protein
MTDQNNQTTKLNSSTPNSILSASKAIIFLHPPYGLESDQLRQDLAVRCKKEKLKILKIIQAKDPYDYRPFVKLIHRINTCHNKPITVIINDDLLDTPDNTIMWAVLGTLITAKFITVITYKNTKKDGSNIILRNLTKYENRFLHRATAYFERYYCFNWNKAIGKRVIL